MRLTCFDSIYELAHRDDRVIFIGSDMGVGSLQRFKDEMPERFFMEGVSEANLIGMAAGLSLEGFIPYVSAIASFLTRRCFEQILLDIGLHRAHVRLIGSGGGLVYAPLGHTHQAIDDMALMSLVPGMAILAPSDATEMRRLMPLTLNYPGPLYIRLAMGDDPAVPIADDTAYEIGKAVHVQYGSDGVLVTTGVTLQLVTTAANLLHRKGIDVAVLHLPTVKPLDSPTILRVVGNVPLVVVVEEHSQVGGLGSAIAWLLTTSGLLHNRIFRHIGLPNEFSDHYGSQKQLWHHYGLTVEHLVEIVEEEAR